MRYWLLSISNLHTAVINTCLNSVFSSFVLMGRNRGKRYVTPPPPHRTLLFPSQDIVFARVARLHGTEVIFLKYNINHSLIGIIELFRTKSDSLVSSVSSQEEASSLLSRGFFSLIPSLSNHTNNVREDNLRV